MLTHSISAHACRSGPKNPCAKIILLLSACIPLVSAADDSSTFPQRPVTIISTFSPGSGPDAMMRVVADILSKTWKQPVIVDNRTGGAGFIAVNAAKNAQADGYTLMLHDGEALSALPHLYKNRKFKPLETFSPIGVLYSTPFLVVVPAGSSWKSVGELLAAARQKPQGISYGTWGMGSSTHLQTLMLERRTGTKMLHVPYREMTQLYTSVGSSDVNWAFGGIGSTQAEYKGGRIRYLAVAAKQRIPQMPDVPTLAESGGPADVEVMAFAGLFAPKGMSSSLQAKIHKDLLHAIADPEVKKRYDTFSFAALKWSPDEMRKAMEKKSATYEQVIRDNNISIEQ